MNTFKIGDRVTATTGHRKGQVSTVNYVFSSGHDVEVKYDDGILHIHRISDVSSTAVPTAVSARPGNEDFLRAAVKAMTKIARTQKTFTTDDIWTSLAKTNPAGFDVEPRALGSLMLQAAKQNVIKATTRTKTSKRPECHKRPVRVWKSLVFTGK